MGAALLEAAADILENEGPDGLSVRRIAAAAGVAPMGVYNHFESKSGIVEALFIQGFQRYRALALAHPMVYQLMFLNVIPGFEPSEHALEVAGGAFANLVAAVQRAMAAGVIADGSATDTAHMIWASIHGWVSLELMGIGFVEDQAAGFDRVCKTILAGLSANADADASSRVAANRGAT